MSALDPLNDLVAWVIIRLHAVLGSLFGPDTGLAWGLSIVILVMPIRLCLVPLFVKQVHAQRKMAQHAPHLQELRKKYKGDKQRLNEETMKFYKENGVNPLAGCLPMIPQMIVFFALFSVLRAIADWKPGTTVVRADHVGGAERPERRPSLASTLATSCCSRTLRVAARGHRDRADCDGQRLHHLHDRPAEREARSHADQRGPGQPDGPVAEVHAVHRPVLLADRPVLAVRPGALLGDHQPVDARPAVLHVPELDHRARPCRRGGRPRDHGGPARATQSSPGRVIRPGSPRPGPPRQAPASGASAKTSAPRHAARWAAGGARSGTATAGGRGGDRLGPAQERHQLGYRPDRQRIRSRQHRAAARPHRRPERDENAGC